MKFNIDKNENKKEKNNRKASFELILFVFSMCALTVLLIFGMIENNKIPQKEESDTNVFEENKIYEIFDLELLVSAKITDRVSEF